MGELVNYVAIDTSLGDHLTSLGTTLWDWYYPYKDTSTTFSYSFPVTIYKYQIKCPKIKCKKMNWLELDKITPCTNCGAKLKAVLQVADFEIPVGE